MINKFLMGLAKRQKMEKAHDSDDSEWSEK